MRERAVSREPRVYAEWTRCPVLQALSPCMWTADSDKSAKQGIGYTNGLDGFK